MHRISRRAAAAEPRAATALERLAQRQQVCINPQIWPGMHAAMKLGGAAYLRSHVPEVGGVRAVTDNWTSDRFNAFVVGCNRKLVTPARSRRASKTSRHPGAAASGRWGSSTSTGVRP
jgi:hypothetical protein